MSETAQVALANGIELAVWDSGPRDAPPLVFLHGFPENHRTWRHQIARLSDRYRCIAPDQRGYGGSSKPQDVEHYAYEALVGDVFLLAEALDLPAFTVLGHDWGGALAWGVAMFGQATGKVNRAVIANAPHPVTFQRLLYTDPEQRAASQYMRAFRDPANDALVREHGLGALLMKALDWKRTARMEPEERARLFKQWSDADTAFAMLNWYRASAIDVPAPEDPLGVPTDWSPPPLPNLAIPTLALWGMDDEALLPANVDSFAEVVDDLIVERIEGSGHFVLWEAPGPVNEALDRFLEQTA